MKIFVYWTVSLLSGKSEALPSCSSFVVNYWFILKNWNGPGCSALNRQIGLLACKTWMGLQLSWTGQFISTHQQKFWPEHHSGQHLKSDQAHPQWNTTDRHTQSPWQQLISEFYLNDLDVGKIHSFPFPLALIGTLRRNRSKTFSIQKKLFPSY